MRICRLQKARRHPRSRRIWAALILSPFNGFSSRNRREVPRRVPHRRLLAHRRPPIAPTLPPPGRQVARGAGAAGPLQPFVEILPNDLAVPSSCIPQSITGTLSSSSYPGHLQFTTSHSFRAKDRNTVASPSCGTAPRLREAHFPKRFGADSGEATFAAKIYLAARISFRCLRRCDRERRLDLQNQTNRIASRISTGRRARPAPDVSVPRGWREQPAMNTGLRPMRSPSMARNG